MKKKKLLIILFILFPTVTGCPHSLHAEIADGVCEFPAKTDFAVYPYLQNPAQDAMTLIWFSEDSGPGKVRYWTNSKSVRTLVSQPKLAQSLAYSGREVRKHCKGKAPSVPYRHRIRMSDLAPGTAYHYTVEQGNSQFSATFRTAPRPDKPIRFIVYADCETQPESHGAYVSWPDPKGSVRDRKYLIDQTRGYANNLEVIASRQPHFIGIAGDLVEIGGAQRHWNEFWKHNCDHDPGKSLASHVPIVPAMGNHEYYGDNALLGFGQPDSENAAAKYLAYFETPRNNSADSRYYRLDYGPITLIVLDGNNDSPNLSEQDSNFMLLGEDDPGGGHAPCFGPGSRQYAWLEDQLKRAQKKGKFTFVMFHHAPYSQGPHGLPPGMIPYLGNVQSGRPLRVLTPLFLRYGVDGVFSGHDEMYEHSQVKGTEMTIDGEERPCAIHFFDVGIGGDGLRGPAPGLENPHQTFLAHTDAPEQWEGNRLVDGGKHYGHLEVNIRPLGHGRWEAMFSPVYVFPVSDRTGTRYLGYERRVYKDVVKIVSH